MKKNKLLAIVLCVAMIVTQFAMLGVSAETTYTALSGNDDFLMGVNIHPSKNYAAYSNTYEAIKDSEALGSNIIRIDGSPANAGEMAYYASVGDVAAEKGMQVMLVNAGKFLSFVQATEVENEGTENETVTTRFLSVSELDLAAITAYYTELATVLNGRVKYYQLGNEMDNKFYKGDSSDHGASYSSNSYYDVTATAVALNTAKEAIKSVDPDAQVGVNFNYYHRGFIHGLKSVDCDPDTEGTQTLALDYIGMDFYSNQIEEGVFGIGAADYTDNIEDLAQYNEPIIVCEANITAESWNENDNTEVYYEEDADWLAEFVTYCYNHEKVSGFIAYELYDQPARLEKDAEGNPVFNREAFFGLIDKDGNKKDTYTVLQQLFGGTGVSSEDDMPQMPETVDAVITDDVIMYAYGKDAPTNQTGGNDARITLDTPIDLSAASYIECDIYVSDAENFNAYSANGEKLALILYTGDGATGKRAYFEINTTVTEGWNHFKFDKTSCRSRGATGSYPWKIDWADVNMVSFGTHNRNETASFTGTGTALITNIYATIAERDKVPEVNLTGLSPVAIYEDMCFSGAWIDGKVNTSKTIDPTVDISTCDYIEFDVYIENYENFMQYETSSVNGTWVPVFITGSNTSTGAYRYKLNKYVTKSGWNHVVIPISEYDSNAGTVSLSKINHVGLRFEPKDGNTIHVGEHYAIANVYATREEYKVAPEVNLTGLSPVTLYEDICFSGAWIDGKVNTSKTIDPTVDISNCDYIEFDVYIENYENFMQYETSSVNGTWVPVFITGSNTSTGAYRYKINKYVTKSGWNHVVIPISEYDSAASGTNSLTKINHVGLRFEPKDGNTIHVGEHYAIANVYATSEERNVVPEVKLTGVSPVALYEDMCFSGAWIDGKVNTSKTIDPTVDISTCDYIEFDVYIENYENFMQYETSSVNGTWVPVFITGSNTSTGAYRYKLNKYVTKSGWNHVVIPISEYDSAASGTNSLTKINHVGLRFEPKDGNTIHVGEHYAIANVYATKKLEVPTEVMQEKIDFIGASLNTIEFNESGEYTADLQNAVDISGNQMMIELDVYVSSDTINAIQVKLVDNANGYVKYSFNGLTSGWNRLAIRLSDSTEGEADFANITGYAFYGTANTSVIVSNFYAAAYVKGDGNRDGKFDITDLVRMKKYTCGIAHSDGTIGNVVAMDVSGDDYLVNAQDLSAVRCYFLTDKWPEN